MKDDFFFQFSVPLVLIVHNIVTFQVTSNGPRQANLVLIANVRSESRGTFRQKARSLAGHAQLKFVMTECSET